MRTERARAPHEHGLRRETVMVGPGRSQGARPAGRPDRRRPLPGPRAPRTTSTAATARHDRVAWAFAAGATQRGVDVLQHTPVTGLLRDGDRVRRASRPPHGPIAAGIVLSAVGGRVTPVAAHGRRPAADPDPPAPRVRDQRLRPGLRDDRRLDRARRATSRRPSAARCSSAPSSTASRRTRASRRSTRCARYAYKITRLLPFLRDLRILRTWAGICDISADFSRSWATPASMASSITTGWGTWGFKAIPAGGEGIAELIATGRTPDAHRAVRARPLPDATTSLADQGSAGTR